MADHREHRDRGRKLTVRYGSTAEGIVRSGPDGTELLDLPYLDLGAALTAGLVRADLDTAPARAAAEASTPALTAPVRRPGDVWAFGVAYKDHVDEAEDALPTTSPMSEELPPFFLKATSSICGPGDPIVLPALAPDQVDYEGEIALVIGRGGSAIDEAVAWDHVFGVTASNDVSARDVQVGRYLGGMMDFKSKSFDSFTPVGPWVVTPDALPDRDDIGLETRVNGKIRQSARTSQLLYSIPRMVAAVSRVATLAPGDLILTGTPGGVGFFEGRFLKPGDEVTVEVEGAGALTNRVEHA